MGNSITAFETEIGCFFNPTFKRVGSLAQSNYSISFSDITYYDGESAKTLLEYINELSGFSDDINLLMSTNSENKGDFIYCHKQADDYIIDCNLNMSFTVDGYTYYCNPFLFQKMFRCLDTIIILF